MQVIAAIMTFAWFLAPGIGLLAMIVLADIANQVVPRLRAKLDAPLPDAKDPNEEWWNRQY